MPPRKATKEDYVKLQGGMPEVRKDNNGLWHVWHRYDNKDPMDVTSHKSPLEGPRVNIGGVEYNARLLRDFHGRPCELNSRRVGGYGYARKRHFDEGGERSRA